MAPEKHPEGPHSEEQLATFASAFSRRSKLRRRFRGYDRYAVDYLLNTLDTEAAAVEEELVQVRADLEALQAVRAVQDDLESILRDTIVSAERAAREQRERTERESTRLLAETRAECAEIREDANARRLRVEQRISELERVERTTRERCRSNLREGLDLFEADEYVDFPEETARPPDSVNGTSELEPTFFDALRAMRRRRALARQRRL
jgi:cell division septum initiation protein DivIVA